MAPTSIQNDANLAQARRQGLPENQQKYETIEKTQTQAHKWEQYLFFWWATISSKNKGLNGWAFTDVFEKRK